MAETLGLLPYVTAFALAVVPDKPNIVMILTDDQDMLLGGASSEPLPRVANMFATEGVTFTNHFVRMPSLPLQRIQGGLLVPVCDFRRVHTNLALVCKIVGLAGPHTCLLPKSRGSAHWTLLPQSALGSSRRTVGRS